MTKLDEKSERGASVIGGMMGHLRERSREEAERKRDLWQ